ncbi:MAG: hypothetical protein C0478_17970 [Planctomyces sp.]|nr:hypothetical protein [Planctomyces sp.]
MAPHPSRGFISRAFVFACLPAFLISGIQGVGIMPATLANDSLAKPPVTKTDNIPEVFHGETVVDPYRWLEDQKAPATREWLSAQANYLQTVTGSLPRIPELKSRLAQLLKVDSVGMPVIRGGKTFFSKRAASADVPSIWFRPTATAPDELLIDPQQLSSDGKTTVNLMDATHDGTQLICGVRTGGEDEVTPRLFDVATRTFSKVEFPKGRYSSLSFSRDGQRVYLSRHDQKIGPRAYVRDVATGKETLLFGQNFGPERILGVRLSEDDQWLVYHVYLGASSQNDVYVQSLAKPGEPIVPFAVGIDAEFDMNAIDHRAVVRTTWQSPRGRVLLADLRKPVLADCQVIVPQAEASLEGVTLAGGKMFIRWLKNVVSELKAYDLAGKELFTIDPPTLGSISGAAGAWDQSQLFYSFSSYIVPGTIYQFDIPTQKTTVWHQSEIPFDSAKFTVKQVWFPSKDGTKIPMFIAHRKDLKLDGTNPTLLYGYGGFAVNLTPGFSTKAALWMELGGVYAVANLRGGGEFGEDWHTAGYLKRKQNVFDDFYAAAEYLIANKYTSPAHLAINGGSNGGLLVGTAMTQRPDLFAAVVCSYPLLDMLRYHQFLVARFWVPEYGSSDDPEMYPILKAYSPYHHIDAQVNYPAAMFITGDADTRVDPNHARKMVARLQAVPALERPIVLMYDDALGHTGARPVSKTIDDLAIELAFLLKYTGPKEAPVGPQVSQTTKNGSKETADAELDAFFDKEWEQGLKNSPTFASYLGDERYDALWPDVSLAAIKLRHEQMKAAADELAKIRQKPLSPAAQFNARLYARQLKMNLEETKTKWYLVPLTQREGIQDENSLTDSLQFDKLSSYKNWIARLNGFPVYMDQIIALMEEGIKEGRLQPKITMQRVVKQIERQIVDDPTKSLFYKPLLSIPKELAPHQEELQAAAKEAISTKVVPAYAKFLEFFNNKYLPACYAGAGVSNLPGGDEIYRFRVREFTTLEMTPDEVHQIGLSEVARIRAEMEKIREQVKFEGDLKAFFEHLRTDPRLYFQNEKELLTEYEAFCKRVDPQLTKLFKTLPRIPYGVKAIPANMAPDTTAAYYYPPSADGSRAGMFFVNLYKPEMRPKYEIPALSLHESVPGHHLQIALSTELQGVPNFRRFAGFTAFVEGWALYSESLGEELGVYEDPYAKFGQLTYEMWRAIRLVVDTGIHSKGWTREQAIQFFRDNSAKTELDIVNEVDRYISWPGQALAYKIGELKIKELRRKAKAQLGDQLDLREFHEVILKNGAIPLAELELVVDEWLAIKAK